jgi:DNA gyrase subunit A
MVRMAQYWSLRYPLVDGQGNFGSVDGDSPAAMRYTEARLKKTAEELLSDLEKDTVDFSPNFDDSLSEPSVLPTRIPNLLVNGSSGIAVGMATNMAPHNLTEVIDGTIAYINNKEIDIDGLMEFIKAPDFPTGGTIYGYEGVKNAFHEGKGRIVMRAKATIEEIRENREAIIVTEIPYQVNKADMIQKTAALVNEGKLVGISEIRDESDRNGMRIVYEIKRDAIPNVVLNKLFKYTSLQTSFSVNNIALVKGRPVVLNLKDLIVHFVDHRHEVVIRRSKFELKKAEDRAHILEGLIIASDNIDEVIALIRGSKSPDEAREKLMSKFKLSDLQSRAIVEMRLRQLTGLEQDKLRAEYNDLLKVIEDLKDILNREDRRMDIIKTELEEVKKKFGDERRSIIEYSANEMKIEDLIPNEEVAITISHAGYIKRTNLNEYKVQNRGGVGSKGSATRDKDFLQELFVATNHNWLLIFTEKGKCFWMRIFEVPEGNKAAKGRAIQNLINIEQDDKVKGYVVVKDLKDEEYTSNNYIIMCTKKGIIKKTSLEAYSRPRTNGINAIGIREGDELLEAKLTNGESEILMAIKSGRAIRFNESKVRSMGRTASGVRGITLSEEDEVIGMVCAQDFSRTIMVVSENGYGKRTLLNDPETNEPIYRITNRGGKGVKTLNVTEKTGNLIAIKSVTDDDDLMIINKSGLTIRMHVADIRSQGRATQGVKLINLKGKDQIAAVAKVEKDDEEDLIDENIEGTENSTTDIVNNPTDSSDLSTEASNDDSTNDNE